MRLRDRFLRRLFVIGLAVVLGAPWLMDGLSGVNPADPLHMRSSATKAANDNTPQIPEDRATHILYGDRSGGGHLYGIGKPCKSEFPKGWRAEKVLANIQTAAANDNADWQEQENGYFVAEAPVDGVKIRVVLSRDRKTVITAYPVNVKRNPCPAANDNRR